MDNQIEQLKSANNYNEDWAILPYDQIEDGQRWIKLIEEIDELRDRAASAKSDFRGHPTDESSQKENTNMSPI